MSKTVGTRVTHFRAESILHSQTTSLQVVCVCVYEQGESQGEVAGSICVGAFPKGSGWNLESG